MELEIAPGEIRQIIHKDKILEDEVKPIEIMHLYEYKKITVQKRTIKDKTYTSYLLGIPDTVINFIIYMFTADDENKEGYTILEKIDNQTYKILITDELKPGTIRIGDIEGYDIKNKIYKTTLPKKKIEYLQAYDKYLENIDYINKKYDKNFKPADIGANIIFNFAPADAESLQKEVIMRFITNIDDKFKNSIELINNEIPDWLDLLTTIPKEFLPSTFY